MGGYLSLLLIIGLVGGLAMGAVAGARRTQSAFPVYLSSTNPSDVETLAEFLPATGIGYSAALERSVARLPYVKHLADVIIFNGTMQILQQLHGSVLAGEAPPTVEGSLNGEFSTYDKVTVLRGHMPDPLRIDEFAMSQGAAAQSGLHLGSSLRIGFFTDSQVNSPKFQGYPVDRPYLAVRLKLVGIVESSHQVVEDDDAALGNTFAILSPALTRRLAARCAYVSGFALQIAGGQGHLGAVETELKRTVPSLGVVGPPSTNGPYLATIELAIRPESIAFGVFGLIAALAALVINGQIVSRLVRRNANDEMILRALGAGRVMTTVECLLGILGSVVIGSLLAVAVAVALSPLAPIGAVRPVYPERGIAFDWTILGSGFALLVVVLASTAALIARRLSHQRLSHRSHPAEAASPTVRTATSFGLPPAALTGIRAAVGAGAGRDAAPVRSALGGAVLAVVVVVASIVFGTSLDGLVSHPSLYGWNWNYALLSGYSAAEDLPGAQTAALLDHDPAIGRFAGVYFLTLQLDGQAVPALGTRPNAPVGPRLLSGHGLQSASQVVLGASTLADLHKRVGDSVVARIGGRSIDLHIVGTATLPTIGGSGDPKLQMGRGAVVSSSLFPPALLNQQDSPIPGPMAELITLRPGVNPSQALRSLDHIADVLNQGEDGPIGGVVSVLRPAAIANYRTIGSTPLWLAGILAAGAIGALGLTLIASVRRRRREFALLKAFGFTRAQVAATVAWHASLSAGFGVVFGLPLGIALGRWLWTLFARAIFAAPDPTVPVLSVIFVVLGALVFADLVATVPGTIAGRSPTALLLRSE